MTDKLVYDVRMNWIPDSPHTEIRVALLAYLRIRVRNIEDDRPPGLNNDASHEVPELRRWIAWLSGETIEVPG